MNKLIFNAMDVSKEVRDIIEIVNAGSCDCMTVSERKAYDCGVAQALSVLQGLLDFDEEPVVHVPGLDMMEEMTVEELEEIFIR
jgi:hypothetical protein